MLVVRSPVVEDLVVTHVEADFLNSSFVLGQLAVQKTPEVKHLWSSISTLLKYLRAVVSFMMDWDQFTLTYRSQFLNLVIKNRLLRESFYIEMQTGLLNENHKVRCSVFFSLYIFSYIHWGNPSSPHLCSH